MYFCRFSGAKVQKKFTSDNYSAFFILHSSFFCIFASVIEKITNSINE